MTTTKALFGFVGVAGIVYIPIAAYGMRDTPGLLFALFFLWVFCLGIAAWVFKRAPKSARVLNAYQRRQEKMRANGGAYTDAEWLALCAQYGNQCLRCGKSRPLTADHVVPVYLGGSSNISNIQPLCRPCNSAKGAQTIDYRPQWVSSE